MAADRHKKVVPHAFKSGILTAASAHFTSSINGGDLVEYTVSQSPLARNLVSHSLEWKDGYIIMPEHCIGLGIELNEDILNKYRVG